MVRITIHLSRIRPELKEQVTFLLLNNVWSAEAELNNVIFKEHGIDGYSLMKEAYGYTPKCRGGWPESEMNDKAALFRGMVALLKELNRLGRLIDFDCDPGLPGSETVFSTTLNKTSTEVKNMELSDISKENINEASKAFNAERKSAEVEFALNTLRSLHNRRNQLEIKLKDIQKQLNDLDDQLKPFGKKHGRKARA